MQLIFTSPSQLKEWGAQLAAQLQGGEILAVSGVLGAGKTTLAAGIASGLGVKSRVNSPTFNLLKIYPGGTKFCRWFCHIDAYRLQKAEELLAIGIEDYWGKPSTITFIEWAEKIQTILPPNTIKIQLAILGARKRQLKIENFFAKKKAQAERRPPQLNSRPN
ncbi:tRNA (adenosine(37)-N6)-threonylcarbamoyltransferase complex ATPase subunit type 1 TsaE [Candidatus Parcubacteria bacterium]|nr:MAG: tRNA (adenosine(37)-N6)-threonylcarbamoyltransferase complex ATPase subunit type 1 TsaE [Candidatus Parcubacteria bacterium]